MNGRCESTITHLVYKTVTMKMQLYCQKEEHNEGRFESISLMVSYIMLITTYLETCPLEFFFFNRFSNLIEKSHLRSLHPYPYIVGFHNPLLEGEKKNKRYYHQKNNCRTERQSKISGVVVCIVETIIAVA